MSHPPCSAPSALPLLLLLMITATCLGQGPGGDKKPGVKERVKAVLDEQAAAWNAGDLERFVKTYWDSDRLTFYSGGSIQKGRRQVLERYRKNYQAEGKEMGKLTFVNLEVTPLGDGWAMARGGYKLVMKKETAQGLFTLVLRDVPKEGWKIVHDHTSAAEKKR